MQLRNLEDNFLDFVHAQWVQSLQQWLCNVFNKNPWNWKSITTHYTKHVIMNLLDLCTQLALASMTSGTLTSNCSYEIFDANANVNKPQPALRKAVNAALHHPSLPFIPRMYWLPTMESLTTISAYNLFLVMLTEINQHDRVYILRPSVVNIGLRTEIESLSL
jgi:hypothetical protein